MTLESERRNQQIRDGWAERRLTFHSVGRTVGIIIMIKKKLSHFKLENADKEIVGVLKYWMTLREEHFYF